MWGKNSQVPAWCLADSALTAHCMTRACKTLKPALMEEAVQGSQGYIRASVMKLDFTKLCWICQVL